MSEFIKGISPRWLEPRTKAPTVELTAEQIRMAKVSNNEVQTINDLLDEHDRHVALVEKFMENHADPQKLQTVADRIRSHTARLAAILEKYPLVP